MMGKLAPEIMRSFLLLRVELEAEIESRIGLYFGKTNTHRFYCRNKTNTQIVYDLNQILESMAKQTYLGTTFYILNT